MLEACPISAEKLSPIHSAHGKRAVVVRQKIQLHQHPATVVLDVLGQPAEWGLDLGEVIVDVDGIQRHS
jgi:hypothetical protein